jgi:copper chaperone CopZ
MERMNCNGCVSNIARALTNLPGVEIIKTDLSTKRVYLDYDNYSVTIEQIQETLAAARYPVVAIATNPQPAPQ